MLIIHSILWKLETKSVLYVSALTDTGFVLPLDHLLKSGIWNRNNLSKNLKCKLLMMEKIKQLLHLIVFLCLGLLMVLPCTLVILIALSAFGNYNMYKCQVL